MNQLEDDIIINNNKYNIKNEQYMLLLNRYLMCSEDLFIKNNEKPNLINIYENKLDQLKIELQKTKTILNTKQDLNKNLQTKTTLSFRPALSLFSCTTFTFSLPLRSQKCTMMIIPALWFH